MEATGVLAPQSNGTAPRVREILEALVELDFTRPLAFVALAAVYIASRAPWLNLGYGTDPDAWRVALSATYLWDTGEYLPSRLPGYPLHELATAATVKGGWIATNLTTVLISLAGIYLFAWLAEKLEIQHRGALVLGFAFMPLLWINSVMTMDYMWGMTFILATYLALIYRAPTLAGFLLGLAAGFRLTSLFMLLPFGLLLWRTGRRGEIRTLALTSIAVAFVAYTPAVMEYGLNIFNFYDQKIPLSEVIKRLGKDGLGIIGTLSLLGALALSLQRLKHLPGDMLRDPHVLTWGAVVVVLFASYTRLPHEIAYLIPVYPFALFLLSRYLSRGLLVGVLGISIVAGFVDITSPDDTVGINSTTFTSARIGTGMLLSDVDTLHKQMDFSDLLVDYSRTSPEVKKPAVIVAGFIYPELVMLHKDELKIGLLEKDLEAISQLSDKGRADLLTGIGPNEEPQVTFVWLLEFDEFEEFQAEGKEIYFTPDGNRSTFEVNGYRAEVFGAHELPVGRAIPPWAGGAAVTNR